MQSAVKKRPNLFSFADLQSASSKIYKLTLSPPPSSPPVLPPLVSWSPVVPLPSVPVVPLPPALLPLLWAGPAGPRPILPRASWPFKADRARPLVWDAWGRGAVTWADGCAAPLRAPAAAGSGYCRPYLLPALQPGVLPGTPSPGTLSLGPLHLPLPGPRGPFPSRWVAGRDSPVPRCATTAPLPRLRTLQQFAWHSQPCPWPKTQCGSGAPRLGYIEVI